MLVAAALLGLGWLALGGCRAAAQAPVATGPATQLEGLIEDVPAPASGRVSYDATDNLGDQLGALDPIADPQGGYLGVYHSPFGSPPGGSPADFRISLGYSRDLLHWQRLEVLDSASASMPSLRRIPAGGGYLLVYEKFKGCCGDILRVRYYSSLARLLANRFSAQRDLPRLFSPYNNGTPSILSIAWHGSLARSVLELGFHYEDAVRKRPGPDREAVGTLVGFRRWSAHRDAAVDSELDRNGLSGNHGDRRQFSFEGRLWRLYEAQTSFLNPASWQLQLYDVSARRMYPLVMQTALGAFPTSFGNPTAQVEPAPAGRGQVMAVTTFVFSSGGASREPGELVYYQPVGG